MRESVVSRRAVLAGALASTLLPDRARAAYPDRPIRWIVAYPAGGGTDTLARVLAEAMTPGLGQPIVIENRPGGATTIGAQAAAHAAPDGHTLLSADNGTLVNNLALFKALPYDPRRDFREVGLMARFPLLLAVTRASPAASVEQFVERARAEPGRLTVASAGIGSPHHLALERLAREAGLAVNHVPYRGMAPALNDAVAGTVEAVIVDHPSSLGHVKAGTLRPLAACSATRIDGLADVPTMREALGLQDYEASAWQGLVVPRATPDDVVRRLSAELAGALRSEPVRARMRQTGIEPLDGGPDELRRLADAERALWVPLIESLGIKLD